MAQYIMAHHPPGIGNVVPVVWKYRVRESTSAWGHLSFSASGVCMCIEYRPHTYVASSAGVGAGTALEVAEKQQPAAAALCMLL